MAPAWTSSQRASPGRMGSPAASALVQPECRNRFVSRSQTAPEPARQRPPDFWAANSSYSLQLLLSSMRMWWSLPASRLTPDGMGYPTRSDSLGHRKDTEWRGVDFETML